MRKTFVLLPLAVMLSLSGMYVSYMLFVKHIAKKTGVVWFDSTCGSTEDSEDSCSDVLASEYGTFPTIPPDVDVENRRDARLVWGLFRLKPRPVALFGLIYFLALAGWYVAIGRPRYPERFWHLLPVLLNLVGAIGSANFIYIMATKLDVWCPWCVVSHAINFVLLLVTLMLWPTRPRTAAVATLEPGQEPQDEAYAGESGELAAESNIQAGTPPPTEAAVVEPSFEPGATQSPQGAPHPSMRLVVVTLLGILAATAAYWQFYNYSVAWGRAKALDKSLEGVRKHADTLYAMYNQNPKHEIPIREDDPTRGGGSIDLRLILFSDFQCPHCRRFARQVDKQIEPLFDGHLKVIFKHFPASKACDQRLRDAHPYACAAAKASEAARILGGNDAFWKAHDLLFASGHELKNYEYKNLAKQLDLDPDTFIETMESPEVIARIQDDIQLGLDVGVKATPAMFISGRQVPRIAKSSPVFWVEAKKRFDAIVARLRKDQEAKEQANVAGPPAPTEDQGSPQQTQEKAHSSSAR